MIRPTKAAVILATKKVIRFCGPVAGAVKGELSKQETARAACKAGIVFIATQTSVAATVHDPDFQTNVLIPLAAALLTGVMDGMSRLEQGTPKPPSLPDLPPVPPVGSVAPEPKPHP